MELGYWREMYFSLLGVYIRCQEQPILICFVGFFGGRTDWYRRHGAKFGLCWPGFGMCGYLLCRTAGSVLLR